MDLLDILLQGASGGGMPSLPMLLQNLQTQQVSQPRTLQPMKAQPSVVPQRSLEDILGGSETQPEGSSIFAYGGGVQPTMESSNDRIRLILDALMQGEAPPGQDPNIGPQAASDFTPVNPQPGQTFGLKGYEDAGFGFNPETRAFTNIGVPKTPEVTPQVQSTSKISTADIKRMSELSTVLESAKVPADIRSNIVEQTFPQFREQKEREKLEAFKQQKEIARDTAPAPAGVYLDKEGIPYSPAFGADIDKKATFYRANSPQQKVLTATGMVNAHVDRTLDHLKAISLIDKNRLSRYMSTELSRLRNDPDIVALIQFLGPASAMAIANAYASSGVSMRGGVTAAMMFKDSVFSEGDDLRAVLTKLKDLTLIAEDQAKFVNLHPSIVKAARDRVDEINRLLGETSKKNAKGGLSSNRVKVINPQGQTVTLPAEQLSEALKPENGYQLAQ